MPFDSTLPAPTLAELWEKAEGLRNAPVEQRLAALADILDHPDFKARWKWNYTVGAGCAIGVWHAVWGDAYRNYIEAETKFYGPFHYAHHRGCVKDGFQFKYMSDVEPCEVAERIRIALDA